MVSQKTMPNDAILFKIAPKWFSRGEMGGTKWFWSSAPAVRQNPPFTLYCRSSFRWRLPCGDSISARAAMPRQYGKPGFWWPCHGTIICFVSGISSKCEYSTSNMQYTGVYCKNTTSRYHCILKVQHFSYQCGTTDGFWHGRFSHDFPPETCFMNC